MAANPCSPILWQSTDKGHPNGALPPNTQCCVYIYMYIHYDYGFFKNPGLQVLGQPTRIKPSQAEPIQEKAVKRRIEPESFV